MKKLVFLVLLTLSFEVLSQKIYIIGKVIDLDQGQPVPLATLKNIRTKVIAKTTIKGDFYLPTVTLDSVEISCIGYKTRRFYFTKSTKDTTLFLKQESTQLDEVTIFGLKDKTLKREIEALNNEDVASKKFTWSDAKGYGGLQGGGFGFSPISMLYDAFSKEGKSHRKLAFDMQQDRYKYFGLLRYNRIAGSITKLSGTPLSDFRDFCALSNDFILTASDYDLTFQIMDAWSKYQKK